MYVVDQRKKALKVYQVFNFYLQYFCQFTCSIGRHGSIFCPILAIKFPKYRVCFKMETNDGPGKANEDEDPFRQICLAKWHETWSAFTVALRSTDDFHPFEWTWKLLKSGICVSYFKSGLHKLKIHIYWRSWVPALAIALIVLVVASYFASLREIIRERWCCPAVGGEGGTNYMCSLSDANGWCRWLLFHDATVMYLGLMILFNFLSACFRSPGVVLQNEQQLKDSEKKTSRITKNLHGEARKESIKWCSKDSRGGFCGIDPTLDTEREGFLVQTYYNIANSTSGSGHCKTNINSGKKQHNKPFPSSRETFCGKCNLKRPPRCHHCSTCNRWYVHLIFSCLERIGNCFQCYHQRLCNV
jgi:hypothetical protein